jgi:DNA replication protein DnaC
MPPRAQLKPVVRNPLQPFKTFNDPVLVSAYKAAQALLADWAQLPPVKRPRGRWLSFWGSSGTGKTFLSRLLYGAWVAYYIEPSTGGVAYRDKQFTHWPTLIRRLRSGGVNISRELDCLIELPLLVIDEVGATNDPSGFVADVLCQVVSGRLGHPTLWTGNITLSSLRDIDERIASRMVREDTAWGRNVTVEMDTDDFASRT